MSTTIYNIIIIVASLAAFFPALLLVKREGKKFLKKRHYNINASQKIKIESKSGVIIEFDSNKRNDLQKVHQAMNVLLGK